MPRRNRRTRREQVTEDWRWLEEQLRGRPNHLTRLVARRGFTTTGEPR